MLIVNKADGDNIKPAELTQKSYQNALHLVKPITPGWNTPVLTCSAVDRTGLDEIFKNIDEFVKSTTDNGFFEDRRISQRSDWFEARLEQELRRRFNSDNEIKNRKKKLIELILSDKVSTVDAVEEILKKFGI